MSSAVVSDSVRDLRVALEHRWLPDILFAVLDLTAYLDESGTHGGSVATVMAGVMASGLKWERYEKKFGGLRRKYGFNVFRTKTFKDRDGDFKDWPKDKQLALLDDLEQLSARSFLTGVTMTLDNADYEQNYKRTPDVPRKMPLVSKYGLCFETCLLYLAGEAGRQKARKLHVVCEAGAANEGDANRIFFDHKAELESRGVHLLRYLTFADKGSTPALMLADFFAHTRWLREFKGVPITENDLVPPGSKQTVVTALNFTPGGLATQKQELIRRFQERAGIKASSGLSS